MRNLLSLAFMLCSVLPLLADSIARPVDNSWKQYLPTLNATFKGKYEVLTDGDDAGASRFQVRNMRVSIAGDILPALLSYRAEVDLCASGKISMLDAWGCFAIPATGLSVTAGQMRVPYTIDSHRAPHKQVFANRSWVAKYGGTKRDVGVTLAWTLPVAVPTTLQGGLFNGSGIDGQGGYWTRTYEFAVKAQTTLCRRYTFEASCLHTRPDGIGITAWNAGFAYDDALWHLEGEYVAKCYRHGAFEPVNIVNAFAVRRFPLGGKVLTGVSALARYDYMGSYSNGRRNDDGLLYTTESRRQRLTAGSTLILGRGAHYAEVRLNYEQYFYPSGAIKKPGDTSKFVAELMIRF